ncbi:hypothetical protein ACIQAC_01330 [Streptomyces sp. NPDC088387]|uniref:hypothetical protein n=1 Tax=Streptomyces sp. NPDC088387 TaxID=3365859 RepID=UPI0038178C3D
MTRLARIADRLAVGSRAYARRVGTRAAAWCARGRRDDLPGWRGTLGIFVRIALLTLGGYLLARLVRAVPHLMWVVTGWWVLAAWRAGRPATKASAAPSAAPTGKAIRALLLELMGDDSAVHLSTVLAHLQRRPDTAAVTAGWGIADLRACLEGLGVPVHLKVKARGKGPTRGVRRADLAPSPAVSGEASTAPSTAA